MTRKVSPAVHSRGFERFGLERDALSIDRKISMRSILFFASTMTPDTAMQLFARCVIPALASDDVLKHETYFLAVGQMKRAIS